MSGSRGNAASGARERRLSCVVANAPPARGSDEAAERACEACGEPLAARRAIDAAMRASGDRLIAMNASACAWLRRAPYPASSKEVACLQAHTHDASAIACGVAAGQRLRHGERVRVVLQTSVIAGAGMALCKLLARDDDVLCIAFDDGASFCEPAKRTLCAIREALAHRVRYLATATIADAADLERKVARATTIEGARYVHVLAPHPARAASTAFDAFESARLAVDSGLFPLLEAHEGRVDEFGLIER